MAQTAVEFLVKELRVRLLTIKSEPDGFVRETMINNFLIDTEKAKEMEKQQIINAYENGYSDSDNTFKLNKQYYNETFNK